MKRLALLACLTTPAAFAVPVETNPDTAMSLGSTDPAPATQEDVGPHALGLTLYADNDGSILKPNGRTDRHYTAGTGIGVQWQNPSTDVLASSLPTIDGEFNRDTKGTSFAGGAIVSMNMYTPEDIASSQPILDDRPYAGWTYGGFMLQRANRASGIPVFEHLELDLGTIGPSGQAGKVQKWVHKTLGYTYPSGWDNEIRDEVGGDLRFQRRWRIDLIRSVNPNGFGMQLIPEAGITGGTFHDNLSGGATLRAGWNLPDDSGPDRMRFPGDFTQAAARANGSNGNFGVYGFLRSSGRYVIHDSTIEGSFFRSNPVEAEIESFVAEIQTGVAMQFLRHWEISYSQTYTSPEFVDQRDWDSFGSFTLRYFTAW
jgi:lipid A 3-O-deacylase